MKNVIFIAPPAAGKGTLSEYLVNTYGYVHISTGDLLRNITKSNTEFGNKIAALINEGKFISDDIMFELIEQELNKLNGKSFILDGIPRNINQAEYLSTLFEKKNVDNYVVINIDIDKDLLEKRATGRRLCNHCKSSYNVFFDGFKPKVEDTCDKCNSKLIQREDDTLEVFQNRYKTYLENTLPLIEYYKEKGLLKSVDASKPQDEIIDDVIKIIKGE